MKMHLFILPSKAKNAGRYATVASFPQDCISSATSVTGFEGINNTVKSAPWYGLFFDNEYIDEDVKKNLKTFLMTVGNDVLVMYRKNYIYQTADFYPRIFRSHIRLNGLFRTEQKFEFEKILNGWICEHGYH